MRELDRAGVQIQVAGALTDAEMPLTPATKSERWPLARSLTHDRLYELQESTGATPFLPGVPHGLCPQGR